MTVPANYAFKLARDAVGVVALFELNTTQGFIRLVRGEDGTFTDVNGVSWLGSTLISVGDISVPRNGAAPSFEIGVSYAASATKRGLISIVREHGVAAVVDRKLKVYLQYFESLGDILKPIEEPYLTDTFVMRKLNYSANGAKQRSVSIVCEGAFSLRAKPSNGRYTVTDHQRRTNSTDISLKFMRNNSFESEPFFAI